MNRYRSVRSSRPAIASLELVLVFPFLLAIVSLLFVIAQADVAKVQAATAARQQTWRNRPTANAGGALSPTQDPSKSEVASAPQVPVALGPIYGGRIQPAVSNNTVIANTWGYASVPFANLSQNCQPHEDVVALIAADIASPGEVSLVFTPLRAFDPTNPVIEAGGALMGIGNTAVIVAGEVLDGGGLVGDAFKGADAAAKAALDVAQATPVGGIINGISKIFGGGNSGLIDKLKDAIDTITNVLDVFDNLNEAAHGRPGNGA